MISILLAFLLPLLLLLPTASPAVELPLVLTLRQRVGMAPLTIRVKVRAEAEGREVCVMVDGPEYRRACRTLWGVTWTQDFLLVADGEYAVWATSGRYRTPEVTVRVIGLDGEQP